MSLELKNSMFFARATITKYLRFFFFEVSVGATLDLIAVYAAISRIVVVLDYISFILPALPLIHGLIHGMSLGRGIWWWVHEGYVYYASSLPLRNRDFVFFRSIFSLMMEHTPSTLPYYLAMYVVGIPLERALFVFVGSTWLFILMSGVGGLIASHVRDWFKISASTSLFQWSLFALTPTLYALDYLARFSPALYYVVASNPLTILMEAARSTHSFVDLIYMVPLVPISLLVLYSVSESMTRSWSH